LSSELEIYEEKNGEKNFVLFEEKNFFQSHGLKVGKAIRASQGTDFVRLFWTFKLVCLIFSQTSRTDLPNLTISLKKKEIRKIEIFLEFC